MEKTPQTDWRAIVVDPSDPNGTMKAKIKVLGMMEGIPDEALPWAEFLLPIGYRFEPVNKGDLVWVDFPYGGDTRRPRIIGAAMDWQGGTPNTAPETGGKGSSPTDKAYQPPKVDNQPAAPQMSQTKARDGVISRNGILEVRSINGGYSITNMAKHATVGFNEAGEIIISTSAGVFIHSGGNMTLDAGGDMLLQAKGKMTSKSDGEMLIDSGAKMTQTAKGDLQQKGSNVSTEGSSVKVKSSGSFGLEAGSASYKAGTHAFTR